MGKKDELANLGREVLGIIRNELYFDMPYLVRALGNLGDIMDLSVFTIGTDGRYIRFNPRYVFDSYMSRPGKLNRAYMHMLLHNLLGHPWGIPQRVMYKDDEGWLDDLWLYNIAADVTVESVIDAMDVDYLRIVSDEFREDCYARLSEDVRTFTANRLFKYFKEGNLSGEYLVSMEQKFKVCDHSFWERLGEDGDKDEPPKPPDYNEVPMTNLPLKESWEKVAEAVRLESERSGSLDTGEQGRLSWTLKIEGGSKYDYRKLLESFMIRREVAKIDPDAFDLAYYTYGMEMYGNMPLIEELEGKEETAIDTIVIAIDTSASTRSKHVKRFLDETYSLLGKSEVFFESADIVIMECDDLVQKEVRLKNEAEFREYIDGFEVSGGYGTDFVPVFTRIRDMRDKGELKQLRTLLYFTDGYGNYPVKATPYKSFFVFLGDCDYDDSNVPDWAGKVYIQ